MKQILDVLPAIIFFVFFKIYDIYIATASLIVASVIQIAVDRFVFGKFNKLHNWMFVILLFFGSLTIFLKDPIFLKWKVTLSQSILGTVLLISQYVYKKPLIGFIFKNVKVNLPDAVIGKINLLWAGFFFFIAVLNLFVAFGLPAMMTDQELALEYWVNFKVWGIMALSFIIVIITGYIMTPYIKAEDLAALKASRENQKNLGSVNENEPEEQSEGSVCENTQDLKKDNENIKLF
ncbi:MAG: septation protein IspZ [Succinivibrionaceae bacterium]|nr:septation protein IspZ [Succinivibrionaceae bacterium]